MLRRAQYDLATLATIKPGLDTSLAEISDGVERFLAQRKDESSTGSVTLNSLHRIIGVLQMARLEGVAVVCRELHMALQDAFAHPESVSGLHRDVFRHALFGITHFLDELAQGADNAPLRLFNQYQALQQLRGIERAFEQDLFFPNLSVTLPPEVLAGAGTGGAASCIKAQRSQYQQGLMRWLRQDDKNAALQLMQSALQGVMDGVAQDEARAYWWIALGMLDCLRHDGLPPELSPRKLLGRIDQQLRRLSSEDRDVSAEQSDLNEMLYLIAHSHSVSTRVDLIKQTYALDLYLPEISALPMGNVTQLLNALRSNLLEAEEIWESCVQGDDAAYVRFIQHCEQITLQSQKLDRNTLQYLANQIYTLSQYVDCHEYANFLALDMAMALLLLDSGISHYSNLGSGFQEQARILSERMHAAVRNRPRDAQKMNEFVELHCRMEQVDMIAPLAREMLVNLQNVEQGLNAFFNDASRREELPDLLRLIEQMAGGLHILSHDLAAEVAIKLGERVTPYLQNNMSPQPQANYVIAGAVSVLESYFQQLVHGQQPLAEPVQNALLALNQLHTPSMVSVDIPAGGTVELQRPIGEDQELLEVFLEEAHEVLGIMRSSIEICELHPDSSEPLTIIRRGFHTLKGSGRMVGLTDLGEMAWSVERALNRWLVDEKTATTGLLDFVKQTIAAFEGWVEELDKRGCVRISADELVATAKLFEEGLAPPDKTATVSEPAVIEEEMVVIGDVSLSPVLFRIASTEAKQHVTVLRAQFVSFSSVSPSLVHYDFMRAAHTLAGVNRTIGFLAVAELAYALEAWLQARMDKVFDLKPEQRDLLNQVILELESMTECVCNRQTVLPRNDLVEQLNAGRELLIEHEQLEAPPQDHVVEPVVVVKAPEPAARPVLRDDLDEQLVPVFLEEADELCPQISVSLRALRGDPEASTHTTALKRLLHTLKGCARMAGAMRIGEMSHAMEERLLEYTPSRAVELLEQLEAELDEINTRLEALRPADKAAGTSSSNETEKSQRAEHIERRALDVGAERALHANLLRVRSDVIDRLVNEAGEVSVARSRIETELSAFKESLLELTGTVSRLSKQLREVEIQAESQMQARFSSVGESEGRFDPLEFDRFTRLQELTRFMNESVHDVQTVQQSLLKNMDKTSAAISSQARTTRDLQQGLMGVRMVPFASIGERLYRIVRQTAKEMGKRANLELVGAMVELDRSVLEKMTAPFEHLLRNAIVHGLEDEAIRLQSGKDPIGEIRLSLRQENNEVVFELDDDGSGVNFDVLRERAESQGLLQAGDVISDEQLTQMIFVSGLSTARVVNEVAGRGVGMDVVRSEIAALGGRIDVSSKTGQGMHLTIRLPLTLAVMQTLMLRVGDTVYALPSSLIEQVRQEKVSELTRMYQSQEVEWQHQRYSFHYLAHLLGDTNRVPESSTHNFVLLLRSAEQRIALHVDALLGKHEAVIKNIGPQLARLPGIAGATVRGDGRVVLILNPLQLSLRIASTGFHQTTKQEPQLSTKPIVMVVDDSLTVRKITSRLLQRAGYQVITAKDGVDALEQLNGITPDVMLLDIEMPRMDGFELIKQLRRDAATLHLPVIMITSRTADKHRNYAMDLGANEYLGKPYQEEVLLEYIARFVDRQAV